MTDHLPECDVAVALAAGDTISAPLQRCDCAKLRACEARVVERLRQPGRVTLAVEDAYGRGVADERERIRIGVDSQCMGHWSGDLCTCAVSLAQVLAVIDGPTGQDADPEPGTGQDGA